MLQKIGCESLTSVQPSSMKAYRDIQPSLGKMQAAVLDVISYLTSPTNLEISKFMGIPINSITPRTNELVDKGLVVYHQTRVCSKSGNSAMAWRVVV